MLNVDNELKAALRLTKKQPMFFGFIAHAADSKLLVQKKKVPSKVLSHAKTECGGGRIFSGRCQIEKGILVFELAKEPPSTLAVLLKKTIKSNAEISIPVEVRVAADLEDDEEVEDEKDEERAEENVVPEQRERIAPTAAPAPSPNGKVLTSRLNALKPDVKIGLAGPDRQSVHTLLRGVHNLLKKSDFGQAARVLDALEKLVVGSSMVPPPASPVQDGAAVVKRLNGLTPRIKTALAGPDAAFVHSLVRAVHGLIKSKDFVQAARLCDDIESLTSKTTQTPAPKKTAPAPEILFRQARLEYDSARKAARAGVEKVQNAILEIAGDDPQMPILREGVAKLDHALAGLDDALLDTLDAAMNAKEPEARKRFHKQAVQQINVYMRFVKTDELLNFVDTNAFLKGKVRAPLFQTLKTLKTRLTTVSV